MTSPNPLNVYTGHDSIHQYYDPDCQPLLPLVEVPRNLNPFLDDKVRIYAKMMSALPAHNVKALPGRRWSLLMTGCSVLYCRLNPILVANADWFHSVQR